MNEENKKKVIDYISSQRDKGINDDSIKKVLLEAGWNEEEISSGFAEIDMGNISGETSQEKKDPIDFFEEKPQETQEEPQDLNDSGSEISPETETSEATTDPDPENSQENEVATSQPSSSVEEQNDLVMNSSDSLEDSSGQSKKSLTGLILIVVVIILVLLGASVAAYYVIKGTGEEKNKEEVMVESLVAYMEADSFQSSVEIDVSTGEDFIFNAGADGYFKQADNLLDSAMKASFQGGLKIKNQGLTIEIDTEGETRLVDGVYYINFIKAPEVPFFPDTSFLENVWIDFDLKENISTDEMEDIEEIAKKEKELIDFINKNGAQILEIAQSKDFIKVDSLSDKNLYKYLILVDFEKTADFLNALAEELPVEKEISDSLKEMASELEAQYPLIKKDLPVEDFTIPLELHIEKRTGNMKMILIDHSFNIEINQELAQFYGEQDKVKADFFFQITFKDFNKSIKVDVPKDSKSFEELMEEAMGALETSEDLENDSDLVETEVETEQDFNFNNFLQAGAGWFKSL